MLKSTAVFLFLMVFTSCSNPEQEMREQLSQRITISIPTNLWLGAMSRHAHGTIEFYSRDGTEYAKTPYFLSGEIDGKVTWNGESLQITDPSSEITFFPDGRAVQVTDGKMKKGTWKVTETGE